MYKSMVAISIHRVGNGHFNKPTQSFSQDYYPYFDEFPKFEETLAYFSKQFGFEMTPDIIAQIFISFIQSNIFS